MKTQNTIIVDQNLIDQAIETIVSMNTLPPQIDFISNSQKAKHIKAQEFIQALPVSQRIAAEKSICKQIDQYFVSGAAYYDSLF